MIPIEYSYNHIFGEATNVIKSVCFTKTQSTHSPGQSRRFYAPLASVQPSEVLFVDFDHNYHKGTPTHEQTMDKRVRKFREEDMPSVLSVVATTVCLVTQPYY